MEITQANFNDELENIAKHINSASFLAVDGEFTGLTAGDKITSFDTPEERYHKLRKGSVDFLLIQFGLSAFEYCTDKNSYLCHAYNFYIYPRQGNRSATDIKFLSQSSSLQFLSEHGFNFNKWIYEGVPYLRTDEEERLRGQLGVKFGSSPVVTGSEVARQGGGAGCHNVSLNSSAGSGNNESPLVAKPSPSSCEVPPEQQTFINGINDQIEHFANDRTKETLHVDSSSPFQRKLIYQLVNSKYSDRMIGETKYVKPSDKSTGYILLTKADQRKRKIMEEESEKREYDTLDEQIGFTKIVKLISQSGKLVVGHNMLLDTLHLISHFISPLPESYSDFKHLIHSTLPRLIDTKVMASTHPFREHVQYSGLDSVYKTMSAAPFDRANVALSAGSRSYETESAHEAGYDAYITGSIFISMINHLGKMKNAAPLMPDSNLLEPFVNKLHLMRVQDVPYMNLTGEDVVPDRSHVFHITFPDTWTSTEINSLFYTFGSVYICWLDDKSALVSLNKKGNAATVVEQLITARPSSLYQVQTYTEYKTGLLAPHRPHRPDTIIIPAKRRTPSWGDGKPAVGGNAGGGFTQMMSVGSTSGSPQSAGGGAEMMLVSPAVTSSTTPTAPPIEDIGQPIRKKSKAQSEVKKETQQQQSKTFAEDIDWD